MTQTAFLKYMWGAYDSPGEQESGQAAVTPLRCKKVYQAYGYGW